MAIAATFSSNEWDADDTKTNNGNIINISKEDVTIVAVSVLPSGILDIQYELEYDNDAAASSAADFLV